MSRGRSSKLVSLVADVRADVKQNTEWRKGADPILLELRERMIRVETKLDSVLKECDR